MNVRYLTQIPVISLVVIGFVGLNEEKKSIILIPSRRELVEYLKPPVIYSMCQVQRFADANCGQWCLYVLNGVSRNDPLVTLF